MHVDVERVERGAARGERLVHHLARGRQHAPALGARQRRGGALVVQLRAPQRLVGVDVADPRHQGLVEQRALETGAPAAQRPRPPPRRRTPGPSGRARCAPRARAGPRGPSTSVTVRPPKVRWSTKRSSGPPSSKRTRMRRCFSSGRSAGWTSIWPLMPRCASSAASASPSSIHRYLPRRRTAFRRRSFSRSTQLRGAAGLAAHRAGMEDLDVAHPPTGQVVGETPPDDLDLGELRHRWRARPRRRGAGRRCARPSARRPSSSARSRCPAPRPPRRPSR